MQQAAVPARDPGDQAPAPNRFGAWWASSSDRRFWVLLLGLNLLFSVAWALAKLSTFPRVPTPYPTVAAHLVRAYAREAAPNMVAGAAALAFVLACHRTEVRGRRAWVSFIASPVALFLPPVLLVLLGWLAGTLLHGLDAGRGWLPPMVSVQPGGLDFFPCRDRRARPWAGPRAKGLFAVGTPEASSRQFACRGAAGECSGPPPPATLDGGSDPAAR